MNVARSFNEKNTFYGFVIRVSRNFVLSYFYRFDKLLMDLVIKMVIK